MSDSIALGLVAGGGFAGMGGAALAFRGSTQSLTPAEFSMKSLDQLIVANDTPPGPQLEHAASDVVIGSRTIDSRSEFARIANSGQLDNIRLWTRGADGIVTPTQFGAELAQLTRATDTGRGKRYAGLALMGVGLVAVIAGANLASADNYK